MPDPLLRTVLLKSLRDQRRALAGWSVGLAGFLVMMAAFYPSVEAEAERFQEILEAYPPALRAVFGDFSDFTTPAGYLRAEVFSMMLPLLLLVYAIGRGSDLIAGEEERGDLEVLLAHPVPRRRVAAEKLGALACGVLLLALVAWLVLSAADLALGMGIGPLRVAAACLMVALLALAFGAVAFALGAAGLRKAAAIGIASGLAALAYLLDALANVVPPLDAASRASPFHHYSAVNPLAGGFDAAGALVLLGVAAAAGALGTWRFDRRDVGR